MKNSTIIAFSFFVYISILSCSKKKDTVEPTTNQEIKQETKKEIPPSSDNKLHGIEISQIGPNQVFIDNQTDTVWVLLPRHDVLGNFKIPIISVTTLVAEKATSNIKKDSVIDVTKPFSIIVTAEDKTKKIYHFKTLYQTCTAELEIKFDTTQTKSQILYDVTNKYRFVAQESSPQYYPAGGISRFVFKSYDNINLAINKEDSILNYFSIEIHPTGVGSDYSNSVKDYSNPQIPIYAYVNFTELPLKGRFVISSYNPFLKTISGSFELEGSVKSNYKNQPTYLKISSGKIENVQYEYQYLYN